jgi:hypothetical protein
MAAAANGSRAKRLSPYRDREGLLFQKDDCGER